MRKDREKIGHRRRNMRGKARKRKSHEEGILRKGKKEAIRGDKREREDNRQRK